MKYDLHIHTKYSPCSVLDIRDILKISKRNGMGGIAVTDHNSIRGSLLAKKMNNDRDFEVIIGSEIKTDKGDILAYYLNKDIKSRRLFEVIDEIKRQGGIVAVPHPFRVVPWVRFKCDLRDVRGKVDAIETFNSRMLPFENEKAQNAARKYGVCGIGGSDAHFKFDISNAYTVFEGDLTKAIRQKKTIAEGTIRYGWLSGSLSFIYRRLPFKKSFFKGAIF